jgi:hypothetical protein
VTDETKTIEPWPSGYDASCKARNYRARAMTISHSIDSGGDCLGNLDRAPLISAVRDAAMPSRSRLASEFARTFRYYQA